MKKKLVAVTLLTMMVLAGCNSGETTGDTTANNEAEDEIVIGFSNMDDSIEMCMQVKESIIAAADEAGVKVIAVDNKSDPATAVQNCDNLLTQGIDVLVEFNGDAASNATIKEKCEAEGVGVIGVDIPVPDSPFMGADNEGAGILVGDALGSYAEELWQGDIDKILLIDLPGAGELVQMRMDGIVTSLKEQYPDITDDMIVRVDGQNGVLAAQQATTDFLTANQDAEHILIGTINEYNAQGALAAIQSADREDDCVIVSHGCTDPVLINLRGEDNCWKAGVGYFPEKYGEYIVPAAIEMAKGNEVDDNILMEHAIITRENVDEFYPE